MSKYQITMFVGYREGTESVDEAARKPADAAAAAAVDEQNVIDMVGQLVDIGIMPDVINHEFNKRATHLAGKAHAAFCTAAAALGDGKTPELGLVYDEAHDTRLHITTLNKPAASIATVPYKVSPARQVRTNGAPVQTWVERAETADWEKFHRDTVHLEKIIRPRGQKPSP